MAWTVEQIARTFLVLHGRARPRRDRGPLGALADRRRAVHDGRDAPADAVPARSSRTPPVAGLTDVQRCVRTTDIDEVGDNTPPHGVRDARQLEPRRLLQGDVDPPVVRAADRGLRHRPAQPLRHGLRRQRRGRRPTRSRRTIWRQVFADAGVDPTGRINPLGEDDNWWSNGPTGPCGPDTEMFVWVGEGDPPPFADIPEYVEIWNNVFMTLQPGRGRRRSRELPSATSTPAWASSASPLFLNGHSSVWQTDELARLLEVVAEPLGVTPDALDETAARSLRIVTDHLRAGLAIAAAGIRPPRPARATSCASSSAAPSATPSCCSARTRASARRWARRPPACPT